MLTLAALAALAGALPLPEAQGEAVSIVVEDGRVLARDISTGSRAGDAVVARLPPGVGQVEWTEAQRLALLRNRFPGGGFALLQRGPVMVVQRPAGRSGAKGTCFASRTDIPSGTPLAREDLSEVECGRDAAGPWLAHDAATRTLFARRDVPAGTFLGRIKVPAGRAVAAGSELVFRTREGPVTVERQVVALQPARAGRRIFTRTEDGKVLVSTLAAGDGE